MGSPIKIGIIGGTGFYQMPGLSDVAEKTVTTPFGNPSSSLMVGNISGVPVAILARHGRGHAFPPHQVNYRANIWALREEGVTHVLAVTACGSLVEEASPGTFVLVDSFIDRTTGRQMSFYGEGGLPGVCHIPMEPAFCARTRAIVEEECRAQGVEVIGEGTVVTIQGPRFGSKAESKMHKMMGGHIVNMTTVPEVVLAKEAGLSYTTIALVTDYDCWKEDNVVNVENVMKVMSSNVKNVIKILIEVIPKINSQDWSDTIRQNKELAKNSVMGVKPVSDEK